MIRRKAEKDVFREVRNRIEDEIDKIDSKKEINDQKKIKTIGNENISLIPCKNTWQT